MFGTTRSNVKRMREHTEMAGKMSAKIKGVNTGKEKRLLYRVYQKKLNRFEIALNFAKHLFVSGFLYI